MYSVKNIEKILLAEKRNVIKADSINENTREEIKKALELPDYQEAIEEALRNGKILYRGRRRHEEYSINISTNNEYKTEYDDNILTKIIKILPSWNEYPKLSDSITCINNPYYAPRYLRFDRTDTFAVFPKNGAKLAICPTSTFSSSFLKISNINEFDNAIIEFFKMLLNISESSAGYIFERDKKTMLQKVHQLDEIGKNLGYQLLRGKIKNPFSQYGRLDSIGLLQTKILELMGEGYSFIQIMEEYLSPENNGFKLGNIFNIPSDDVHEIWFEGSYLMIPSIPLMYYLNGIRI